MVRMVNSGTEATMSAVRAARGYTGREKIIKFENRFPDIFLALDAFFAYKEEIDKVAIWILNRDIDQANAIIEIIETELK